LIENKEKELNQISLFKDWPRGGMVTQRIANPFIPVRFWAWPPILKLFYSKKKVSLQSNSSVAQLVEQLTVNQLVAGSSPARGANND
tara:strand:- start:280 stop:540 length:261 start_codon:yes stop_codon:yes gene_type:complete